MWDLIAPVAGAALGSVIPGVGTAIGAGIGSGLSTGIKTGNPLAGALAAGGSIVGGNLGGSLLGGAAGGLGGQSIGSLASQAVGSTAGNVLGDLGGTSLGSVAGSSLGSTLGSSVGQSILPKAGMPSNNPAPFIPSQAGQMNTPPSLSQFGNLSPTQQASNIATQGVYGGGQGPEESKYFLNLINRQLVDPKGKVGDTSSINPVENNFLGQLGLGGYNNSNQLLKNIKNYSAA